MSSNYIKNDLILYYNKYKYVNLYKRIFKYDTMFDFCVKIDIFGFCNLLVFQKWVRYNMFPTKC